MIRLTRYLHLGLILFLSDFAFAQSELAGKYEVILVSEDSLQANFIRSIGGPIVAPEWSQDLLSWHKSGESSNGVTTLLTQNVRAAGDGIEAVELTATIEGSVTNGIYLRLQVQDDPPAPEGFAFIRAGTFSMGSPLGEPTRLVNESLHQVTLTQSFFMASTETTWNEWVRVRDWAVENGYFASLSLAGQNGDNGDSSGLHPVTRVTWYEAVQWCNARSELEGKTPVYYSSVEFNSSNIFRSGTTSAKVYADWSANGYRLPTEAEWEYACRAGTTTPLFTGNIVSLENDPVDSNLDKAGWYSGNSDSNTHPVGGKQANAWGLFDTHGNVSEYCWDFYFPDYGGDATDPKGPGPDSGRTSRITRGGNYQGFAQHCRSAHRDAFTGPAASSTFNGFRLALNISE